MDNNWTKFTNLLMDRHNINISIEKRIFLNLINSNNNEEIIKIDDFKKALIKNGILNNDIRIKDLLQKLNNYE